MRGLYIFRKKKIVSEFKREKMSQMILKTIAVFKSEKKSLPQRSRVCLKTPLHAKNKLFRILEIK